MITSEIFGLNPGEELKQSTRRAVPYVDISIISFAACATSGGRPCGCWSRKCGISCEIGRCVCFVVFLVFSCLIFIFFQRHLVKQCVQLEEHQSSHQFIFASTVTKYANSPHHWPPDRLNIVFRQSELGQEVPFIELDSLYYLILRCQHWESEVCLDDPCPATLLPRCVWPMVDTNDKLSLTITYNPCIHYFRGISFYYSNEARNIKSIARDANEVWVCQRWYKSCIYSYIIWAVRVHNKALIGVQCG